MKIKSSKLPNGIDVITSNIRAAKLMAVTVTFKSGTVNQKKDQDGVAHLLEHLIFKGTKTKNETQISQDFDENGIYVNAETGINTTSYYFNGLSGSFLKGVDLLSDILCNSSFTQKNFEKEKKVIFDEILSNNADINVLMEDCVLYSQYSKNDLGRNILGSKKDLKKINLQYVKNFWRENYYPENMVISCVGDINHSEFCRLVNDKFKPLEKNTRYKKILDYSDYRLQTSQVVFEEENAKSIDYRIVFPFELDLHNIYTSEIKMILLSSILSEGRSSLLMSDLRVDKSLVYSIDSSVSVYYQNRGHVVISGESNGNFDVILKSILDVILKFEDMATEKHLLIAKQNLIRSYLESESSFDSISLELNTDFINYGFLKNNKQKIKIIESITLNDIVLSAKKLLQINYPSIVLYGNSKNKNYYDKISHYIDDFKLSFKP